MSKCELCNEVHNVEVREEVQQMEFKGVAFVYKAKFLYCPSLDELFEDETLLNENDKVMKDVYRKKVGLLPSYEIAKIRKEYGLSQKALSKALGWGALTITRYETHQVQDKVHNDMLKKIDKDPEWFLELFCEAKEEFSQKQLEKTIALANQKIISMCNDKILNEIKELYSDYAVDDDIDTTKIRGIINFFAEKIDYLYTVKLMKLMWYVDNIFYQKFSRSVTGMQYQAFPMGALPIGHTRLIELPGIHYIDDSMGRRFVCKDAKSIEAMSKDELQVMYLVFEKYGKLSKDDIVELMHGETAYKETEKFAIIDYKYSEDIKI